MSWPNNELDSTEYFTVNDNALNSAYLAFPNLTQSNFVVHSTAEIITSSSSSSNSGIGIGSGSNNSIVSNTINSNHNNATQRQSGRSNAFEVPMWLILCYCIILLCAIVGNLLVISTLVQNRRMRTITNVFLLNLAISDALLGVLCMPVTLLGTLLRHFIFGEFFCKLIQFAQAVSVTVSSWTLVAISCERYYAICHPLRSRRWQTRSHAYKIIACIWCGSMLCMSPIAMFSQLMPTSRQGLLKCRENWPSYALPYERSYNLFLDLILLVLPLIILSVAYILITRTLCVGMRIEKAMIFGGKQENSYLRRKSNRGSMLGKSLYLSMSSLSTNARSSSQLKLNLALQCYGGTTSNSLSYNNNSSTATTNHQGNFEINAEETDTFNQQEQNQDNLQLSTQRLCQQHSFRSYTQQNQILVREGVQPQQQQQFQHQSQLEPQQSQHQSCCEPFSRLYFKRSNSKSTAAHSARPHLYCMRFATLKTALPEKEGNSISNFCTAECCSAGGDDGVNTATINMNAHNLNAAPPIMALSSSPTATTSTTASTMYRYQMHQHHHNHQQLQHNEARCYCTVQQMVPKFNNKANSKKSLNCKRNLKTTESVLRRNNIAKNLESKKRVVKMLFVLVLEFFICWTPLYVINTVAMYIGATIYEYIDYTSISVLQLLAYSSSCCNPITYCFMNANFRRAFWDTFKGLHWCGKPCQRKLSTTQNGANLLLASSMRVNSCTVQTLIDSPRL